MLTARLRAVTDPFPAKTALYCVDMTTGQVLAAFGEDTQVVSASTIKVAVLFCALQGCLQGEFSLDQFVPIEKEDYCDDTQVFEPNYRTDGASLREMLYWMIVLSDNTATNAVLKLLTYPRINGYCASLGLKHTCVQRKMLDFAAVAAGFNNYTSPKDQFRLYELLYRGEILNDPLRAVAFDYLSRCRHFDSLQRYLPEDVTVLHKPGGLDHLDHDAGLFLLEKNPYFLGVFTWDGPAMDGEPHQSRLIGQISRIVYDYVTKESPL